MKNIKYHDGKALIVSIDEYNNPEHNLRGCVNDGNLIKKMLKSMGYKHIYGLFNKEATKEKILTALINMVSAAKHGDNLLFYFSGHGSQVIDKDNDEIDNLDEILVPTDLDWESKTYIKDDDLYNIFKNLENNVNLTVILDCCHSGDGTRNLTRGYKSRYINHNINLPALKKVIGKSIINDKTLNHTVWTACRSSQTSKEIRIWGKVHGVFTYHLCKLLKQSPKTQGSTLLWKVAQKIVKYNQTPTFTAKDITKNGIFINNTK